MTIVDGTVYFDRERDTQLRENIMKERARLIQKMIGAKKSGERTGPAVPSFRQLNSCEEDHEENNGLWGRIQNRIDATEIQ